MTEEQMTTFFAQIPEETYQKILQRSLSEGKSLAQVAQEAFDLFFSPSLTKAELTDLLEVLDHRLWTMQNWDLHIYGGPNPRNHDLILAALNYAREIRKKLVKMLEALK